jgi:hypothetical protein
MRQVTGSTGKLERGFAIVDIVAAILVGAVLYFLYPNSFKNNLNGGTSQDRSQTGPSQYGGRHRCRLPHQDQHPEEVATALVPEIAATGPFFFNQ